LKSDAKKDENYHKSPLKKRKTIQFKDPEDVDMDDEAEVEVEKIKTKII